MTDKTNEGCFVNRFHFHNELLFDYIIDVAVTATLIVFITDNFIWCHAYFGRYVTQDNQRILVIHISLSLEENSSHLHYAVPSGYSVCTSVKLHIIITGHARVLHA